MIARQRVYELREHAKLAVRTLLHRADLEVSRGPFIVRLARVLETQGIDAVLDVGANVGQYGQMLRAAGFTGRVISCEPMTEAHRQLARRAETDPAWTAVRTAVGATEGSTTINVAANSFSSSVLEMRESHRGTAAGFGVVATETVPLTTVAALVAEHGLDPATTLLKIDTQGYESAVLSGAGDLLGRLAALQLELPFVELYRGQQLFHGLYERLRHAGYGLHVLEGGYSDAEGRMLECDGLFLRLDLQAEESTAGPWPPPRTR